jgi:hypothetical protein
MKTIEQNLEKQVDSSIWSLLFTQHIMGAEMKQVHPPRIELEFLS